MKKPFRASLAFCLLFSAGTFAGDAAIHGQRLISLMSYNIKGIPLPWVRHGSRYSNIGKQIQQMRQAGIGPEILALQEAFVKGTGDVGEETHMRYKSRGPGARGVRINAGVEVLSDHPITGEDKILYSNCAQADCFARKGAMLTRIKIEGLPFSIDLYNTHMNADPGGHKARLKQSQQLLEFISKTHDPANILISVGDFNFRPGKSDYDIFASALPWANALEECGVLKDCEGSSDPMAEWAHSIDHQFYTTTEGASIRPVYYEKLLHDPTDGDKWSDHDAVLVHYLVTW